MIYNAGSSIRKQPEISLQFCSSNGRYAYKAEEIIIFSLDCYEIK